MTMLLLILAVFLAAAQAQCPERCMCEVLDQLEYDCDDIQVRARKNDYINLQCTSANITCDDIPSIDLAGNKTIRSLGVKDCPPSVLQCISGAFGVSGVYKLTLTRPTEEIQPEDLVGYQDVDYMMLREGKETTIPIHLLPSLPALKDWRIADGALTLSTLPSQPFSNYSEVNIKLLEISTNGIKDVPQGMFEGLNGLLKLDFWGNKVERLRLNSLKGLDSLTRLNLNVNNLSGIEVGTLTDVPNVKEIYLTKNRFSEVPSGLFAGLDKLEIIDFTMNLVPLTLQNNSFSNLPSLKTLYFNDSEIHTISENTFLGSKNITVLSLTSNKLQFLPPNLFMDQSNLKILDLSKNKLEKLSERVFVGLKELEYLNLDGNQLKSLPDFLFSGLRNLKTVSLNHNFLKTFTDSTFQGAVALETLSIENNKLTIIDKNESNNPLYMSYEQNSPFSSLVNLKRLLLKYNELDTIYNDWRYVLLNLQLLDLSHNLYTDLQEFEVQFLAKDVVVDLRNNRIATVQLYYAPYPPTNSPPQNTTNSKILLANNPLNCDCVIYQLVKRLRGAKSETVEPTLDLTDTYCVKPVNLQGKPVKKLDLFDLTCDFDDNCPNNCTCNVRPETATAEFDCGKIPVNLIPIPNHKAVLRLHEQPANIDNLNVDILNLTGLNIETVNFKPVTGLETIDLSDNSLKIPPVQLLDSNLTLYLKGNPFECDCWSYNELNLLKENYKFIKDYNEISCSNGVAISELNVVALCDALKTGIIATSTFVTLILIVCIVIIICTKYSNEIIIFMAYKSVFRKIFYIENLDSDKKHDVFLSFSHKDIKFVEEQLLTKLEDDFKLNVCIHYRDWNVGEYISTQILRSVESSRRTIIVLSKNFLESNWAKAEFNVAHNLTLKDNVARVILILLEDVTKDPNLTDELKAYINMNTYLMHGDPRFWQKLKKALPQRKIKFKWQNRMETTPEKTFKGGLDVQLNSKNQLVNMVAKEV